jgi:hypothetical protein
VDNIITIADLSEMALKGDVVSPLHWALQMLCLEELGAVGVNNGSAYEAVQLAF